MRKCVSAGLIVCLSVATASAQTKKETTRKGDRPRAGRTQAKPAQTKSQTKKAFALTPERERQAFGFARQNHPELAELLEDLKTTNPRQYGRALRDLSFTAQRLDRVKQRFPDRHQLLLEVWKWDSRIRLLAAKMTMSRSAELEAELKSALFERNKLRLKQLKLDQKRLNERQQKLSELINRLEDNPETAVEKDFERIRRGLFPPKTSRTKSNQKKTAVKNKAAKP